MKLDPLDPATLAKLESFANNRRSKSLHVDAGFEMSPVDETPPLRREEDVEDPGSASVPVEELQAEDAEAKRQQACIDEAAETKVGQQVRITGPKT